MFSYVKHLVDFVTQILVECTFLCFLNCPVPRIRRQILENKEISKVTVKAIHLGHKIMGQEVVGQAELNPS